MRTRIQQTTINHIIAGGSSSSSSGGGGSLTPIEIKQLYESNPNTNAFTDDEKALVGMLVNNGSGDMFLSNDGTYKSITAFDNFEQYPTFADFPTTGSDNVLYLDLSNGDLYYWDGTNYQIADAGLFGQYLPLSGGTMTGNINIQSIIPNSTNSYIGGNMQRLAGIYSTNANVNNIDCGLLLRVDTIDPYLSSDGNIVINGIKFPEDVLVYGTDSSSNPVLQLKPGTKIASASLADTTNHEILGVNTYTSPKTFDQTEVGSQEALFNINLVYDTDLTSGHATADVYNEDGSYRGKEVFAYVSDVTPDRISATGASLTVTGIPTNAVILSVNYNRILLFSDDYTFSNGTVTITNTDITSTSEATDRIEVTYFG